MVSSTPINIPPAMQSYANTIGELGWDLYMVEGLISAMVGAAHVFRLQDIPNDVPRPKPDENYNACQPQSNLMQLKDM